VFAFFFLFVAIWGLAVLIVGLFNPKDLVGTFYRFEKRVSRIGPLKLGIFFFTDDPAVYRIFMSSIGALLAVGGTASFLSLI
jgi:hypothetical protein